jgi:hypothetical protein
MKRSMSRFAIGVLLLALEGVGSARQTPSWVPTFGGQPGVGAGSISDMLSFDDGSGTKLFVVGNFSHAFGRPADSLIAWDGEHATTLAGSNLLPGTAGCLAIHDQGTGAALYLGGAFTDFGGVSAQYVARWDGTAWSALGSGPTSAVRTLASYVEGGQPRLAAATGTGVQRWNGVSWSALPGSMNGGIWCLAEFAGHLYAGGDFTSAGGVSVNGIARWTGSAWTSVGGGTNGQVAALVTHDDGSGPALYAGGTFSHAGGTLVRHVARWNGASWAPVGTGMNDDVYQLSEHQNGSELVLIAAGEFTQATFSPGNHVARWDGTSWGPLGTGTDSAVGTVGRLVIEGQERLFVAGDFLTRAGDARVLKVAAWDGTDWSALAPGLNSTVRCLAQFDDGNGPALYAGGQFTCGSNAPLDYLGRWNGAGWSQLPGGVNGIVDGLFVHDDGGGEVLYVGGEFTLAGGAPAKHIASWDGSHWAPLAGGVTSSAHGTSVHTMLVHDEGAGPVLIVGGRFTQMDGIAAANIARWDGASWSALGGGLSGASYDEVNALATFDSGNGPELYAAGRFALAGGIAANCIARWNGVSWAPLSFVGDGFGGWGSNTGVYALQEFEGSLFAAGYFRTVGALNAPYIARWDGIGWSVPGGGLDGGAYALASFDLGDGPALYATGNFYDAGAVGDLNNIARWNGTSWSSLGEGLFQARAEALLPAVGSDGAFLYVGGWIPSAIGSGDSHLARYGILDLVPPALECPASITVHDRLPNGPGEVVDFTITASDDVDPSPSVVCTPLSGSLFPTGRTLVTCTATDHTGKSTTCTFPVTVVGRKKP